MQTLILALLPNPEAIGIVDRRVYRHDEFSGVRSDRRRYKKAAAAALCILLTSSGA